MTTFNDPGDVPALDWLDVSLIDVDPTYQRSLDEARVRRILEGFKWDAFGALVVSPAAERYHCTDGQHRLEAAKRHPNVTAVPAIIITATGTQAEAGNFIALNRDRKNISALDRYWAELAAEEDDAKTVALVVQRAGVTIARYPKPVYEPAETIAISAIRAVVDKRGAMRAREALQLLVEAGLAPIKGEFIRAAEILLSDDEFKDEVEPAALAEAIGGNDAVLLDEAKAFAKTHRMQLARALASVWFRRARKKRRAA